MENEYYESNPKKAKKTFVLIALIVIILFIVFLFVKNAFTFKVKAVITYEAGDEVSNNVSDYLLNKIINIDDYELDLSAVIKDNGILNTTGEYTFAVSYKGNRKTGKLIVKDTTKPTVKVNDLVVGLNEDFSASEFLMSCDDYSLPCSVSLKTGTIKDLTKEVGKKSVDLIVKDNSGNETITSASLEVRNNYSLDTSKTSDLEVSYTDPEVNDWDKKTYVLSYSKAFDPNDVNNARWEYYYDMIESDYESYLPSEYQGREITSAQVLTVYNRFHYIIGFAIRVELDDGTITYLTNGE